MSRSRQPTAAISMKDKGACDLVYDRALCRFHYMAMADNRQRIMPMPEDRLPPRGRPLAYPEAVRLNDPIDPALRGEVRIRAREEGRGLGDVCSNAAV